MALDEGAGQLAADRSPSRSDGRLGLEPGADGADPVWIPGVAGTVLRFDGGDALVLGDPGALEPARVTIAAWVRRHGTPGVFAYVVSKGSASCYFSSYGLYTGAGGGMTFYVSDGDRYVAAPATALAAVWDGAWHQVAGTFDGQTVRFYLDGAQVGSGAPQTSPIRYGLASTAPTSAPTAAAATSASRATSTTCGSGTRRSPRRRSRPRSRPCRRRRPARAALRRLPPSPGRRCRRRRRAS